MARRARRTKGGKAKKAITARQKSARRKNIAVARASKKKGGVKRLTAKQKAKNAFNRRVMKKVNRLEKGGSINLKNRKTGKMSKSGLKAVELTSRRWGSSASKGNKAWIGKGSHSRAKFPKKEYAIYLD